MGAVIQVPKADHGSADAAVFRIKILHVFMGDSSRISFSRGEIPERTADSPGNSTRGILARERSVQKIAKPPHCAAPAVQPGGRVRVPREEMSKRGLEYS